VEKGKKERYKSNENLTRKSKVSCIAVVPFFTFILLTLTIKSFLSLYNNCEKLDHWIMQFITFYWLSHYGI